MNLYSGTQLQALLDPAVFHRLVDTVYESVLDPAQMPIALAMLSGYAGTKSADYVVLDKHASAPRGWCSHDSQPGRCPECIHDQQWTRDDADPIISTTLLDTPDLCVVLRLCPHDEAFDTRATQRRQRLERVLPHFRRVARMQQRNHVLNELAALSTAGLDALDFGVMVIGCGMHLKYANAWARAIICANDCFSLEGGRFHSTDPGHDAALRTLIDRVIGLKGVHGPAGSWLYPAPDGRAVPFIAALLVRPETGRSMCTSPLALVFIGNAEARSVMDASVLTALFGLTQTECIIAARLANGETLKEIAQYQWKSVHTVRIHTREILRKTGTHRQSELMRLLYLLPSVDLGRSGIATPLLDRRNRLNP